MSIRNQWASCRLRKGNVPKLHGNVGLLIDIRLAHGDKQTAKHKVKDILHCFSGHAVLFSLSVGFICVMSKPSIFSVGIRAWWSVTLLSSTIFLSMFNPADKTDSATARYFSPYCGNRLYPGRKIGFKVGCQITAVRSRIA